MKLPPSGRVVSLLLLQTLVAAVFPLDVAAAVTAEHRRQVTEIRKNLNRAATHISRKELSDAERILKDSEDRIQKIIGDAEIDDKHSLIAPLLKQISLAKASLEKRQTAGDSKSAGGSFEKDVAPILVARCLKCHGETDPSAGLRLNTFAGIVQGCGGKLVVPGNPNGSMLLKKITATGKQRMPRDGEPLSADEIRRITTWIASGAKFGGDNSKPLDDLVKDNAAAPVAVTGPISINRPSGGERVSFTRDIAPFVVNLCVNCHSADGQGTRQTGFALDTFEKLMRGGRGGAVVSPGNIKASRLWHLVGEQDPIKMPPGQALITRTNWTNLRTWIEEGAKFDGSESQIKAPLRSLVPSEDERRAKELASLSPDELIQRRKDRSAELWRAALGKDTPAEIACDSALVIGNVAEARLKEIGGWCDEDAKLLKKLFGIKDEQIWRGKLTVFVFKDRFSYAEFVQTNEKAELPPEIRGHSRVTPTQDEAYICLQDVGEAVREDSPGARAIVLDLFTEALLQRSANKVPGWAARGLGLALASRHDPKSAYFRGLAGSAREVVKSFENPQDLFNEGAFSPADVTPIGFTLVTHMLKVGGEPKFVLFLRQLSAGKPLADALKEVYSADAMTLGRSYVDSLGSARLAPKKAATSK